MNIKELLEKYNNHAVVKQLLPLLTKEKISVVAKGLKGSAPAFVFSSLFFTVKKHFIFVLGDKEEAAYFYNDMQNIVGENRVEFLPTSYQRSIRYGKVESGNILLRTEVLNNITLNTTPLIIVTYPEALMEKVISAEALKSNTFTIKRGDNLSRDFLIEVLDDYGFERVDFVYEPGQFAVRGSLVDIFSYAGEEPFRIDFFGDEVDTIRIFDIETQLTKTTPDSVTLIPNIRETEGADKRISLFNFMPEDTVYFFTNVKNTIEIIDTTFSKTENVTVFEDTEAYVGDMAISGTEVKNIIESANTVEFGTSFYKKNVDVVEFSTSLQPTVRKNFDMLADSLNQFSGSGYSNYIFFDSEEQKERLQAIFDDKEISSVYTPVTPVISSGFVDNNLMITCFTDHQIFERYHKFNIKTGFTKRESLTLAELTNLHPGDYVVHIDHGIGKFGGLQRMEINGKHQETIKLIYRDNDVLFVSIHSLHRISKYKGKDTQSPKIYKLGSPVWQNLKAKTKNRVKDIAKDLIKLYAERRTQTGFAFSPDSFLNKQLEASFIYEDTPDQLKTTKAVKADMEKPVPMDRLVCGDVGFGKTEIAVRAALKAVADNKQVAVLVPTTILALQHFKTFSQRLSQFPVTVEYISRLRTTKEQSDVLKRLKEGSVDIIIGTHKLVGKNIVFKDLGLLIIDEEQKFGVSVKEKLKQIKLNVDTLTLTATPIPRTLQFSLMGARDLSIINTPPPNRQPIITEVHQFNDDIIKEAVNYELSRNGQVFFIHNRVQNIADVANAITRLCPSARVIYAHGQMDGKQLEKIMLDFIDYKYDVLVATTIIESGLDIPNANTMIINQAQNYGLSDLHQLRGRVGRSNKKAFCYLLAPPPTSLTEEARRRLKAIEDFSELGSGFNIALQDLDIRGAGDILGAEQSGFIADLGFEAYQRILDEALAELKQNETPQETQNDNNGESTNFLDTIDFVSDCHIDTDLELLIPDGYVSNIPERINLYRKLDSIQNEDEMSAFVNEMTDRFGELPESTIALLDVVKLRWIAVKLGMQRIILKSGKMTIYFVADPESPFYQSSIFQNILQKIHSLGNKCKMQEKNNKLTLSFENVKDVQSALTYLQKLSG